MAAIKYNLRGTDYIGVFAIATDRYLFAGTNLTTASREIVSKAVGVECIAISISASDMVGIFARANSNGIIVSNITEDRELDALRELCPDITVERINSDLNTIGNNVLANDRIAIINPDYDNKAKVQIEDSLGVETVKMEIGKFKTIGANNILTNKGIVVNNRATEEEEAEVERLVGFHPEKTTANQGALGIGLSTISNSFGLVAGGLTTGYEFSRIQDGLDIQG
jgi:translation initiation factor 6